MAARAIWKGALRFDDFSVPVKLYAAIEDRNIHFHLLHDQDLVRVKQRMVNPRTGETVPYADAKRAAQVETGLFVVLDEQELEAFEPEASRVIAITRFVAPSAIDHPWYSRPYFLGPDGDEAGYFAFAEALAREQKAGVAKWVMRKQHYAGALQAEGDHLVLIALRSADEIVPASALEPPSGEALDKRELELAEQLITVRKEPFDPGDYHDAFRQRVRELIDAKREGGTVEAAEYQEPPKRRSLADALRESLKDAK